MRGAVTAALTRKERWSTHRSVDIKSDCTESCCGMYSYCTLLSGSNGRGQTTHDRQTSQLRCTSAVRFRSCFSVALIEQLEMAMFGPSSVKTKLTSAEASAVIFGRSFGRNPSAKIDLYRLKQRLLFLAEASVNCRTFCA